MRMVRKQLPMSPYFSFWWFVCLGSGKREGSEVSDVGRPQPPKPATTKVNQPMNHTTHIYTPLHTFPPASCSRVLTTSAGVAAHAPSAPAIPPAPRREGMLLFVFVRVGLWGF